MKKFTAILVCMLLVASLAVTAFAANAVKIDLAAAKTNVTKGEVVDLTISIPEVANLRSGAVAVNYDKAVFEFVSGKCTQGDAMVKSFKIMNNILSGSFTYAADEVPEAISGTVFTFKMKVLDSAEFGKSTISLSTGSLKTGAGATLDVTLGSVEMTVACAAHTEKTEITKEATCKEVGTKVTTCTACGATLKTEEIAKLPHTEKTEVTKAATCAAEGEKVTSCEVCKEVLKTEKIEKLAHTEKTEVTKAATCAAEGEKVTTCTECKATLKTEKIEKLAHTEKTEITKEATCAAEGEKVTSCEVCKEVLKTEKIEKLAHTEEVKVTKEATCAAEGEKVITCTACGESKTETIPALEHTWDEGTVTTPATAEKEGVKTYKCTTCKTAEKTETIAKIESPATADNSMILPFVILMVLSAAGVAVAVIGKKRIAG